MKPEVLTTPYPTKVPFLCMYIDMAYSINEQNARQKINDGFDNMI